MDAAETEQDAVDQVFDARMKRAVAVLEALLAYYRVKKVPPSGCRASIGLSPIRPHPGGRTVDRRGRLPRGVRVRVSYPGSRNGQATG